MSDAIQALLPYLPAAAAVILVAAGLALVRRLLERGAELSGEHTFRGQLTMLVLSGLGLILVLAALPLRDATRAQLLNLAGIVLSAGIALSSTTFIGNAMAGMMLRAVRNFRTGDFIRVEQHFGRVTERGLVHTEIQTEDRDLTTLPNLFLVTHPVTVIRTSGTIVSAEVSIGYDIAHARVERLLLDAAVAAGLAEPFVHITSLGDFSVGYRVAGFLSDVRRILSTRSRLRACAIDALHGDGVEIVSPTFMNTRAFAPEMQFLSLGRRTPALDRGARVAEDVVFDKADQAAALVELRRIHRAVGEKLSELEARIGKAEVDEKQALQAARAHLLRRCAHLDETIRSWSPAED
jgi:small-conductance mechanosensitive channel